MINLLRVAVFCLSVVLSLIIMICLYFTDICAPICALFPKASKDQGSRFSTSGGNKRQGQRHTWAQNRGIWGGGGKWEGEGGQPNQVALDRDTSGLPDREVGFANNVSPL